MAPTVIDPMQCFAGLHNVLPLAADLEINANIEEDVAAEQETLIRPSSGKEQSAPTMNMSMDASEFAKLQVTLMEVSKGVTEGTDAEYKRLMNSCLAFAVGTRLLETDEEFFSKRPQPNAPWIIVAWIMNV
ncbi:hypothetical protein BDR07DRAFT_1493931 [Suillus spraguei]|nr:hypothetical protein BDR07DRAFT_1493931 [Suillus spraguei]